MDDTGIPPTDPRHSHFKGRLAMVRKHLRLGKRTPWPDGLDWPNWKEPHELWFTDHENVWKALAKEADEREAEEGVEVDTSEMTDRQKKLFAAKQGKTKP